MSQAPLIIVTPEHLRELIREAVRAELAANEPPAEPPKMLTVRQASDRTGRCTDTLRRAIGRGDLKAAKPPGSREWLIADHDLLAWASSEKSPPAVDFNREVEKAVARFVGKRAR